MLSSRKNSIGHTICRMIVLIILLSVVLAKQKALTAAQVTQVNSVVSVAWSLDGLQLALADNNGNVRILNALTREIEVRLLELGPNLDGDGVASVAWSPDGSQFAAVMHKNLYIWDTHNWQLLRTIMESRVTLWSLAWKPDNTQIATLSYGDRGRNFRIWDVQTGQEIQRMQSEASTYAVAWSPDGQLLATAVGAGSTLWLAIDSQPLRTFSRSGGELVDVAWHPDGSQLASLGDDDRIFIWDAETAQLIRTLEGQGRNSFLRSVRWRPDGEFLATVSDDGSLWVWDATTGQGQELGHESGALYTLAWRPDGSKIVYGGENNLLKVVDVPSKFRYP